MMKTLIIFVGLSSYAAIKLVPVQRTTRYSKTLEESPTNSVNKSVLDQLQSVKKVLAQAESMRNELHELVGEFAMSDSQRRKVGAYNRAQSTVVSFLEKYDKSDPNLESKNFECLDKDNCPSSTSNSPYSNELRGQIRIAFEREGNYYLELMDSIIQHGWSVVSDSTTDKTVKTDPSPTSAASFKSKDDVRNVFNYWKERSERARKAEHVKKPKQSHFLYYSCISFGLLAAAASIGYMLYSQRNNTVKASIRRRQMQRRQFLINTLRSRNKSSLSSSKIPLKRRRLNHRPKNHTMSHITSHNEDQETTIQNINSVYGCYDTTTTNNNKNTNETGQDEQSRERMIQNDNILETIMEGSKESSRKEETGSTTSERSESPTTIVRVASLDQSSPLSSAAITTTDVEYNNDDNNDNNNIHYINTTTTTSTGNYSSEHNNNHNNINHNINNNSTSTSTSTIMLSEEGWTTLDSAAVAARGRSKRKGSFPASNSTSNSTSYRRHTKENRARKVQNKNSLVGTGITTNNNNVSMSSSNQEKSTTTTATTTTTMIKNTANTATTKTTSSSSSTALSNHVKESHNRRVHARNVPPSSADSTDHESIEENAENVTASTFQDTEVEVDNISDSQGFRSESAPLLEINTNEQYYYMQQMNVDENGMERAASAPLPGYYIMASPSSSQSSAIPNQMMTLSPDGIISNNGVWPSAHMPSFVPYMMPMNMNMNMQYCYGPGPNMAGPVPLGPGSIPHPTYGMQMPMPVQYVNGSEYHMGDNSTSSSPHGYNNMPPMSSPMSFADDHNLIEAIRYQMEYYFSVENLIKDVYLRKKMDQQGYVLLEEIIQFNRIRSFNAPPALILDAVCTSPKLEILQPWAAKASSGQPSDRAILETKIRCAIGWEQWVFISKNSTTSKVEIQSQS